MMDTHAAYMAAVGAAASTAHEEMQDADRSVALARCRMPLSAVQSACRRHAPVGSDAVGDEPAATIIQFSCRWQRVRRLSAVRDRGGHFLRCRSAQFPNYDILHAYCTRRRVLP